MQRLSVCKFLMHLMQLPISIRGRVRPSVGPVLCSNVKQRQFMCSNDDEIRRGPRKSLGQLKKTSKCKNYDGKYLKDKINNATMQ